MTDVLLSSAVSTAPNKLGMSVLNVYFHFHRTHHYRVVVKGVVKFQCLGVILAIASFLVLPSKD